VQGYRRTFENFNGTQVISIFYNGTQVKGSNPKVGIIFVSLDYEKKPYKVNKSAKNWKKLERTTGSRLGRESTPRDLGHRFEIRRRKKIGVTWRVVLVEELAIFLAFKCVSCVSECKQVCEICK